MSPGGWPPPAEPGPPRLEPLPPEEWDDLLVLLADVAGGPEHALNIFTTLGRHPALFRSFVGFGGSLLDGRLAPRTRELSILRTAARCGADYEWRHHAAAAAQVGVTGDELAALRRPLDDHPWAQEDRVVLGAVDEMHERWALGDDAWAQVHGALGDAGSIELVMLVGQYHLVALALRTLRIAVEDAG
ncbi:MAG: carboxymuconolactone decarboxylase family protein [Acidobacteriota bacterium]|nr:carboxymuconolactone decarboxylase family protein [Acidobacteriota bacterium]